MAKYYHGSIYKCRICYGESLESALRIWHWSHLLSWVLNSEWIANDVGDDGLLLVGYWVDIPNEQLPVDDAGKC